VEEGREVGLEGGLDGSRWVTVASSTGPTSEESLSYSGTAGYNLWRIYPYSGSGMYGFWPQSP